MLLDWGQRIRFALDIALGMNYLHRMVGALSACSCASVFVCGAWVGGRVEDALFDIADWRLRHSPSPLPHNRQGILHCDLKTRNLLVDKDFNIKVADFGLSQLKNVSGGDLTLQVGTYRTRLLCWNLFLFCLSIASEFWSLWGDQTTLRKVSKPHRCPLIFACDIFLSFDSQPTWHPRSLRAAASTRKSRMSTGSAP